MPEYKLYYYPFAGGRGEALRVALHHSGVEWENVEMPFGDYQALKADDAADVAWKCGLPVLSVDGKLFTQSLAQLRFVGKLSGLYPEQPMDALAVDEVMDVVQDVLTRTPQDADADVKKAKREEYAAGKLKGYMALLAHRCQSTDGGPYVLGASLTIADLVLYYYVLAMLRSGNFDHVDAAYADQWPALTALEAAVKAHPIVDKWKAFCEAK